MSRHRLGLFGAILGLAAALLVPSVALAAKVSSTYTIHGYEYYATTTEGRFTGTASGSAGDRATWNAVVDHTPLSTTATVTGGYADLLTSRLVHIRGTFSDGSVALVDQQSGCGTQTYSVRGTLSNVSRSDSRRTGTGTFVATLTHYRVWIGWCQVYSASVSGTIGLSF
ncbi:MAG TPA: hypothetical protein VGK63_02985 [Candidatus Limnocylindrales bacterium]